MSKRKSVALATLFSLLLPASLLANHAIKLGNGQWQLIGIAGYYEVAGAGTASVTPNLANGQALVDFADPNNNITWDANETAAARNTVADPAVDFTNNFATAGDVSGVGFFNDPDDGNHNLGLPYHSIVGLRAIEIQNSTLYKAAISFNRPTAPAASSGKDYGAPMRTMYIASPLSNGEPDVMVVYAGNMENQPFKVSFKDANTTWEFTNADETINDKVYSGVFSHLNTYDNPASRGSGLTLIVATTGVGGETSGYRALTNTIDMDIADNITENFAELNSTNFQALDGNATIYRYNSDQGLWAVSVILGQGGVGIENLASPKELGSAGATNANSTNYVNSDFSTWDRGYGYWIKLDKDASVTTDAGILANSQITNSSAYDGNLSAGWNLLSFPDGTLRYATSGFVVAAETDVHVVSPFGDANVTLADAADQDECNAFNVAVVARNASTGNSNSLDVRCLWDGTNSVLVSDKPFFIQLEDNPDDPSNVTSLAGYQFVASDMIDINGSVGENYALRTKLGEYAVIAEQNADYALAANNVLVPSTKTLTVGLPSWFNINPTDMNGSDTTANITGLFSTYMAAAPVPSYDTVSRGRVLDIDSNATGMGQLLLFAANNRFYVRDNTFVRVFDTVDTNGSTLAITYGGTTNTTAGINFAGATFLNCADIVAKTAAATTDVRAVCINKTAGDDNRSVAFFSDSKLNFDVKETNTSVQLLTDRHIASNELNGTVYGAIKRVFQPSELAKKVSFSTDNNATTYGGSAVSNLTYSAVWAEDFPNNGALYYMADQGYKSEMFISAITSDGNLLGGANPKGTISWKALDTTRNPKDWFDSANDFELFWTEKERGYWVYLKDGYSNPVTVAGVQATTSSVVNKHFNNIIVAGEGDVFNWFDGYLSASVGGLVRSGYTSGESYIVNATVGGGKMAMGTTGAVSAGTATFSSYLSDFEVSGYRPTGIHEARVAASDGLGGRAEANTTIAYVKPATPEVTFAAGSLSATSNDVATDVVIYDGNITDLNPVHLYTGAIGTAVDLTGLSAIQYPSQQLPLITTDAVPSLSSALGSIVKDLRVIAATAPATDKMSVFSNMRSVNYIPAYSQTAHMNVNGEVNGTVPTALYNVTVGGTGDQFGIAYRGVNGVNSTLIFKPLVKQTVADGAPRHINAIFDGKTAQVQYVAAYEGQVFYIYNNDGKKWYYGVFPGTGFSTPYNLTLVEATGITQEL